LPTPLEQGADRTFALGNPYRRRRIPAPIRPRLQAAARSYAIPGPSERTTWAMVLLKRQPPKADSPTVGHHSVTDGWVLLRPQWPQHLLVLRRSAAPGDSPGAHAATLPETTQGGLQRALPAHAFFRVRSSLLVTFSTI
jgi:hypothetical protein